MNQPAPPEWLDILRRNVAVFGRLPDDLQQRLLKTMRIFIAEKNWEGCGGLTLTEQMQVTIAAQACLLVLAFDDEFYDHVLTLLVYPTAYIAPDQHITRAGVVIEGDTTRLGEAWYRGPVILSWEDALAGGRQETPGRNLVLHEFAGGPGCSSTGGRSCERLRTNGPRCQDDPCRERTTLRR